MELLYALEKIRCPFLDTVLGAITHLGGEAIFMAVAIFVLWCINKKTGYYLLTVGFTGTLINQTLKLIFKIPRPWIKDPNFKIVESAREGATGYSFPSGHTQNAVGTFGSLAYSAKKRWLRITLTVLALLVAFSRMYLGVHTPLDVGVSLIIATVLVFIFKWVFDLIEKKPFVMYILLAVMTAMSVAYLLFVLYFPFGDVDKANYNSGLKNAYTLFGALLGALVGYTLDSRYIKFKTDAAPWAQAIKYVAGLAVVIAVKSLLKTPLYTLFGGSYAADAVRYFIIVIIASALWPLTFEFFSKLGKKKSI